MNLPTSEVGPVQRSRSRSVGVDLTRLLKLQAGLENEPWRLPVRTGSMGRAPSATANQLPEGAHRGSGFCECGCGERTPISDKTQTARGWKKGEPRRFVSGHNRGKNGRRPGYEVDPETNCWAWYGAVSSSGYGQVSGPNRQTRSAHRHYYIERYGPIPDDHDLHHRCGNKTCVNPAHLEPIPRVEHRRSHLDIKLDPESVRQIRALRADGLTQAAIAQRIGVSRPTVLYVVNGKTWVDVP